MIATTRGPNMTDERRFWGAVETAPGEWALRLWAPRHEGVHVAMGESRFAMEKRPDGVHEAVIAAEAGAEYHFDIDGTLYPDPASRRQAGDVHAPSVLTRMPTPAGWSGRPWEEAVVYELHVGTFTDGGTFAAAQGRFAELAALGVTVIEVMPVAQFAGGRGWGYDGVLPYAPHTAYGTPEDLAAMVRAAQDVGMSVLLDVVYNHFGPDGAYLHAIAPEFFDADRTTPWGPAIDFGRAAVRDFFLSNAAMWVADYGFDGLRIDAVHQLRDTSEPEFIVELGQRMRALDVGRPVHLVNEDERNLPYLIESGDFAGEWNDDFHHAVHCLLTGEDFGYYEGYAADPLDDLVRVLADGYSVQGQARKGEAKRRGAPSGHVAPQRFVNANQTHDQIGNRALGERLISLAGTDAARIAHCVLLTAPAVPMLFMGEEIGSEAPFLFFADFEGDLRDAVRKGRAEEFADFAGKDVPDPFADATFAACRPFADPPPWAEDWRTLTRRLLDWRAGCVVPLLKSGRTGARVVATGARSFHAEWTFEDGMLEMVANLGAAGDGWIDRADIAIGGQGDAFAFAVKVTT